MLFDMRWDGSSIVGWVSPDNPARAPVVQVILPDKTILHVASNEVREDVRDRGLHPTGNNGFRINEVFLPQLQGLLDKVEVRDLDTDVLLFRSFNPIRHIDAKVFRFEMRAFVCLKTEADWEGQFALYYNAIERHPFDTMFAILNNPAAQSMALSGRPPWFRYGTYLQERNFKIVTLLRPPLEEMAERLLFLRYMATPNAPKQFEKHLAGLSSLLLAVGNLDFDKEESVDSFFEALSLPQRAALNNPLTRALGCDLHEEPTGKNIEIALSRLSEMDVVGVAKREPDYRDCVEEMLGRRVFSHRWSAKIGAIESMAAALGENKLARSLVACDLELYQAAETAIHAALDEL